MASEKEVSLLNQASILEGTISNPSPREKPLIVLLYQLLGNEKKLVAYSIQHFPGKFTFIRYP
jgi:hypothetical protein